MYAEDVNYWKTGRSDVDTWIERAKKEIRDVAGVVHGSGSYTDDITGRGMPSPSSVVQKEQNNG